MPMWPWKSTPTQPTPPTEKPAPPVKASFSGGGGGGLPGGDTDGYVGWLPSFMAVLILMTAAISAYLVAQRRRRDRGDPDWSRYSLRVTLPNGQGNTIPMRESIQIGRHAQNDIVLPDATVSSFHSRIYWDAVQRSFFVRDLNSRNGTFVNNRRSASARIDGRSTIRVGNASLRVAERRPK